jgi:hypothetical protein
MELKSFFDTPFDQYADRYGQSFTVVKGPCAPHTGEVITLDALRAVKEGGDCPYFTIRFEDGAEIAAFPEEVLAEFPWSYNPNADRSEAERYVVSDRALGYGTGRTSSTGRQHD